MSSVEQSFQEQKNKSKKYYERNKYRLCYYKLNSYSFDAIEQISKKCSKTVRKYIENYPFEIYADKYIIQELNRYRIYTTHGNYDDCYDAGMIAYLYSVHRCAFMKYNHTEAYIKKMIRIYIICALVIYNETYNICKENGFQEIRLDADVSQYRY